MTSGRNGIVGFAEWSYRDYSAMWYWYEHSFYSPGVAFISMGTATDAVPRYYYKVTGELKTVFGYVNVYFYITSTYSNYAMLYFRVDGGIIDQHYRYYYQYYYRRIIYDPIFEIYRTWEGRYGGEVYQYIPPIYDYYTYQSIPPYYNYIPEISTNPIHYRYQII